MSLLLFFGLLYQNMVTFWCNLVTTKFTKKRKKSQAVQPKTGWANESLIKTYDWLCMSVEKIKMRGGSGGSAWVRQWSTLKESSRRRPRSAMSWKTLEKSGLKPAAPNRLADRKHCALSTQPNHSPLGVSFECPYQHPPWSPVSIGKPAPKIHQWTIYFCRWISSSCSFARETKKFPLDQKKLSGKIPYLLELECSRVRSHKATGSRRNFKTGFLVTDLFRKSQFLNFININVLTIWSALDQTMYEKAFSKNYFHNLLTKFCKTCRLRKF